MQMVVALQWSGDLSRVYPASPSGSWDRLQQCRRSSDKKWTDGRMHVSVRSFRAVLDPSLLFWLVLLLLQIKTLEIRYFFSTPQCHATSPIPGLKERMSHTRFNHVNLFMFCEMVLSFHCRKDPKFRVDTPFDNIWRFDTSMKPRNLQKTNQTVSDNHGGRSEQSARGFWERTYWAKRRVAWLWAASAVINGDRDYLMLTKNVSL